MQHYVVSDTTMMGKEPSVSCCGDFISFRV